MSNANRPTVLRDPRSIDELISCEIGDLSLEAAALIGDPQLHALLLPLREWRDMDHTALEEAIGACSPERSVSS